MKKYIWNLYEYKYVNLRSLIKFWYYVYVYVYVIYSNEFIFDAQKCDIVQVIVTSQTVVVYIFMFAHYIT